MEGMMPVLQLMSHEIWGSGTTVRLSPFATVRDHGKAHNASKSAVRSLEILEILARAGRPLRAVEVGSALGLSPSSTHQLLKTMVDSAYLIFEPGSKRYFPSIRAARLVQPASADATVRLSIDELVPPDLKAMSDIVVISTSQGAYMQIIDACHRPECNFADADSRFDRHYSWVGAQVPIFGSCTGAAWLSMQDNDTIVRTMALCRRELGHYAHDCDRVFSLVERVRDQGYAYGGLSSGCGVSGISVPLPLAQDSPTYVLGIAGRSRQFEGNQDEIVRSLKARIASAAGKPRADA